MSVRAPDEATPGLLGRLSRGVVIIGVLAAGLLAGAAILAYERKMPAGDGHGHGAGGTTKAKRAILTPKAVRRTAASMLGTLTPKATRNTRMQTVVMLTAMTATGRSR